MSDEVDMKYNLLLKDEDLKGSPSYECQTFWNNFIKMMDKQKNNVTLVWDTKNKTFVRVLHNAIKESEHA